MGVSLDVKRAARMFWSAQTCSVANMGAISSVPHLGLDLLAAGGASLTIVLFGVAFLLRKPDGEQSYRYTLAGVHEEHMFWTAQACSWATLAALSHAAVVAFLASHVLLVVTLVSLAVAMLNRKTIDREAERIHELVEQELHDLVDQEIHRILEEERQKTEEKA